MGWSNEFKVGLFVLVAGAIATVGTIWSQDGIREGEKVYHLHLAVPSAVGLYNKSAIKMAGVDIGAIEVPVVVGDHAELVLDVRQEYQLPVDSTAALESNGLLGDRYVTIYPGSEHALLKDGDWIQLREPPPDIEKIERQVQDITADLKEITSDLKQVTSNDENRQHIEDTIRNVDILSQQLREIAEQNHQDIDAIVDNVRQLTASLSDFTDDTKGDVTEEMAKLKDTTDKLNATVADMKSVTGKIDKGEGTIGALVNDRQTVDLLNDTISNANDVISGFSGLHAEVYYTGRYYFGSQPCSGSAGPQCADGNPFYYGNPLAGSGSNTIGVLLRPQEDFWYNFEFNDYPQGRINDTEHYFQESGQHYTEFTREDLYRATFLMNKRWHNIALRLGLMEDAGGFGATYYFMHDKLLLSADVFDFSVGAYPAMKSLGTPNIRLTLHYAPMEHVYFELGDEQPILGYEYGYWTGFAGAGFHFTDDDIKLLLATLPVRF